MKPVVASFCTYFLKAEMLHIYRQITALRQVETFVIAKFRENAGLYPFQDLELPLWSTGANSKSSGES